MSETTFSRQKTLALAGALCGAVIGYLSSQWVVAGTYLLLFILCGGDSMKDMTGFFYAVFTVFALVMAVFIAIGAGLGYQIGKRTTSTPKLALACCLFCAFTALIWLVHRSPAQSRQHQLEVLRAKYYGTDGYQKIIGTDLRPRVDGSGWDLAVRTGGSRGGNYFLYCAIAQEFAVPGGASGGLSYIFSEKKPLALAPGQAETIVAIPARTVGMKYAEERRRYREGPLDRTTLEVHVEADLPVDSEYYGSQWQLIERKSISLSLKDIGIVTTPPSSRGRPRRPVRLGT